jgi:lantibiotic biosynthesis protein
LSSGSAGRALFYAYLSRFEPGRGRDRTAIRTLERGIDELAEHPHPVSLYAGYSGVAWAVAHLERFLLDSDGEDTNASIDEALLEKLNREAWDGPYDLIDGLVGVGAYALERLPRPSAVECLRRVVERLEETSVPTAEGITWWSSPAWLGAKGKSQFPQGYYNLGLAHGTPGIIALLAAAHAAGISVEKAGPLLEGAVAWLLAHELQGDPISRFPSYIGTGVTNARARLAWCYGDLGIAAVLLNASRSVEKRAWREEAIRTARVAAARPPDQSGVVDAGLCHGAAGIAHLWNRLFQETGDTSFREAALYWYGRTLDLRRPGEGAAGFLAWIPDARGELGWQDDRGFLTGVAGIGLALIAAVTDEEPAWDRVLLPNLPGRDNEILR